METKIMKIKEFKILIFILITSFSLLGCGTVKKAFDAERKNSSEEFLVQKKSPLSMPPNFDELPIPKENIIDNEDKDIEELITDKQKNIDILKNKESSNKEFEEFMLDKIKKN